MPFRISIVHFDIILNNIDYNATIVQLRQKQNKIKTILYMITF